MISMLIPSPINLKPQCDVVSELFCRGKNKIATMMPDYSQLLPNSSAEDIHYEKVPVDFLNKGWRIDLGDVGENYRLLLIVIGFVKENSNYGDKYL